ncbi:MAG: SHOCT domain-containing protein [Acidimicrobiales bacterium]
MDSARQILRERLARGEISPEEYATRVEVLSRPDR